MLNGRWDPEGTSAAETTGHIWHSGENSTKGGLSNWYRYGISVWTIKSIDTAYSSYKPYMVVSYLDDDVTVTPTRMSPASGYVPKGSANVFSWGLAISGECMKEIKATSTTFRWRAGSSGTINTIACGTAQKVTVPAGTFTTDDIQWSVSVTLNTGETVTSDWITLSTAEAASTAKPVSPAGIVIDATIVNRFSWKHIISTGTPQSKADLQWSADGATWNTLATVTGADQYYDVPANTFASGTKYWRVRTYNTDNTASAWSDAAEFIAINAPSAPSIVIQSTGPRPRITWQTSEQEAYQLTLSNGYASGTVYGTEKTWRSPVYLADGSYTVRVRVQNQYGMWSEWSAAALPVSHTEGEAITLTVSAGREAALSWQTAGSYDFYLIERDGVAIARTGTKEYTDKRSIGSVTYCVRGCYDDSDNYGVSNSDTVEILPETNTICDLSTGVWLDMRLSETQLRTNRVSFAAGVSTIHLAGLAYPVEERNEQRDRSLAVACAWPHSQRASALALEALVGRLVCLKDHYGNMAIGTLPSLESNSDEFMRRYSFTIAHTNQEEAITIDP
nr:MAG TPA: Oligo alginate lyase [Siphoviridae sp. ctJZ725]